MVINHYRKCVSDRRLASALQLVTCSYHTLYHRCPLPPANTGTLCFSILLVNLQMAANGVGEKRSAEEDVCGEDAVLSLQEVLEEDEALQDEACAVLAGSDHEKCSYPQGYVKRQALYACNTCTPDKEEPAGICLACTYKCHEGHDLFELYTKRNFRCDCGNRKFKQLECKFFPEKETSNILNKYNANFFGLYCTCKRPYPDPEDEVPDEMIQCIVCEDWYHGRHLGTQPPEHVEFQEMVCQACMDRCSFLWAYTSYLAVPGVTKITPADVDAEDVKVDDEPGEDKLQNGVDIKTEKEKLEIPKHPNIKEEKNEPSSPSTSTTSEQKNVKKENSSPVKTETKPGVKCKLQEYKTHLGAVTKTATYWPNNWRSKLCTCKDCMKMYAELEVLFLVDEYDTVQSYENKGKTAEAQERRDPLMTALSSMNRVQQVELICEYNDMKSELMDYLKKFAEEGKVNWIFKCIFHRFDTLEITWLCRKLDSFPTP
ncbi:E3 ubiquitin- ligase UBR7 [Pelobates cultripes]|uniref:Putative E3 ubiquitin-protein ligase UBR7 n=1 Tax=Pelobates cultripes TaxID=61616 RepID=A0AAD1TPL0_PELCU|nr:E3 ubiquitin- ligase UBR7 [Pelobates cultripes]